MLCYHQQQKETMKDLLEPWEAPGSFTGVLPQSSGVILPNMLAASQCKYFNYR